MSHSYDDQYSSAFPAKYVRADGSPLPRHEPGPKDGETPEQYAKRLMSLGYSEFDSQNLAGLSD